ncbi:MAG: DUF4262 domain-containing protein [Actinomycetota bacterium]|nr:DUF4262 domain-containing protein [Actinomycetota bacterium]
MAAQASAHHQMLNKATLDSVRECHCQLCAVPSGDTPQPPGMPATDPLAARVARQGWSVVSVAAVGPRPAYAFTVGLWHSFDHAEASVFGRDEDEMVDWLNTVGRAVKGGRVLLPDRLGDDVLGEVEVFPRPALASWHRHLFGAALAFYRGQPVPMLQLVWPDLDGIVPWERGCDEQCLAAQPRLWDRATAVPCPPGWPFPVSPDALVLTTKSIAFDGAPVMGVVHDEEGEWQFLDNPAVDMKDLTIVHLAHVMAPRPELGAMGDLPAGYEAWLDPQGRWARAALEDVLD